VKYYRHIIYSYLIYIADGKNISLLNTSQKKKFNHYGDYLHMPDYEELTKKCFEDNLYFYGMESFIEEFTKKQSLKQRLLRAY